MNHKLAGCQRTWHSLWDEMFSASAAFDSEPENTGLGFGSELDAPDTQELVSLISERAKHPSNDNASK